MCSSDLKGVLVLLPEIALTPQAIERFTERLGPVAVLHSMLPDTERAVHHERLRNGEVKLAMGARSAVFAPVADLGLIVVDEEHGEAALGCVGVGAHWRWAGAGPPGAV